jgi:hypothetical protein
MGDAYEFVDYRNSVVEALILSAKRKGRRTSE